jgi:hypothetical protein
MRSLSLVFLAAATVVVLAAPRALQGAAGGAGPEQIAFFENKVRPLLAENCLECHSRARQKTKGGLSMDDREGMRRGGDSGAVIKAGEPESSPLIAAVEGHGDLQMPPKKRLNGEQISILKRWVAMGAPDPREAAASVFQPSAAHWSFQPIVRAPALPAVQSRTWAKTPLDLFVLAKLEENGLRPAAIPETGTPREVRTKREALLRRAYFDLIGLPPSPEQTLAFLADNSPKAFEKVVDDLLRSPHHGERWARHWLDTARYSDTGGIPERGFDQRFPYAWGYRDWVISAINKDMPYDQFILNQLAADQLNGTPNSNWAALAFITIGQASSNPDEILNERIDAVGRGFLGLTIACARCHNHKFDPITQADYYALHGVFRSITQPSEGPVIGGGTGSAQAAVNQAKLRGLQDHAWAVYLHIAKRENARMRARAASYFQYAMATAKGFKSDEDREGAKELQKKLNISADDAYWLRGEFAPNFKFNGRDPILGPFVALAGGDGKYYADIVEGRRTGYNSVVLAFLRAQQSLPRDLNGVASLFERFWESTVAPVAGRPVDPGCADFLSEINAGNGMTSQIWKLREKVVGHPGLELMELAVFPWRLIAPELPLRGSTHRNPTDALELKLLEECRGHDARGSELETKGRVNGINMFKLTNQGGPMRAMSVEELPKPVDSPIYPRGNRPASNDPAAIKLVPRRYIEALSPGGAKPFQHGSGRLELAEAIASKNNPLTARVAVNRVWMHLLGEGLVRTPDDLGSRAGRPSHPELLDYLAWWFMQEQPGKSAWSTKALLKLIVLSSVYQQSSLSENLQECQKVDPANALLWRANIRRLDFEAFRDSMLSMAGVLDPAVFGPPVNLVSEPYSRRRSVYGFIDRANLPDLLTQFDFANPNEPNSRRNSTIVPQQSLFLMNSPFTIVVIRYIRQRPEVQAALTRGEDDGIHAIYRVVLQRTPTDLELAKARAFLRVEREAQAEIVRAQRELRGKAQQRAEAVLADAQNKSAVDARAAVVNRGQVVERSPLDPWESLVQVLLSCNEAIYLK